MNRASSPTGWVRNPVMKSLDLDPTQASSYELGWTYNPFTGCLNHIDGLCKGGGFPCYAHRLANGRLASRYTANRNTANGNITTFALSDPFYPRFWPERLYHPWGGEPKGIFVCDMSDLFGIGIPEEWTNKVLNLCRLHKQNRYYLLTKQPQNLLRWSPFPDNCYVGVTATDYWKYVDACNYLSRMEASVKFLSLEPLLSWDKEPTYFFQSGGVSWLVIGACTGSLEDIKKVNYAHKDTDGLMPMPYGNRWTLQPKIEWVKEIVEAADKAGIPVFLKDNLKPLLETLDITETSFGRLTSLKVEAIKDAQGLPRQRGWYELRQEMPDLLARE